GCQNRDTVAGACSWPLDVPTGGETEYAGDGGQPTAAAPNLPAPVRAGANLPEPSKNFSTSVANSIYLHAVQDTDQMAAEMWAGKGGEHFLVWLNKNRQAVKQII
ncbi:hypothetical protein, partial [Pseudomonas aeruginosa]|uniref:hypothetical protein n=1 Tax=Pseudomonas aeruginosa TaxID=287 RepID=UPI0018FE7B08